MRVAVVDDETTYLREIEAFIERWKVETGHQELTVDYFDTAEKLMFRLETVLYDLYLLDIRLPKTNGFDLAGRIRAINENVIIAFITSDDSFLEKGYELSIYRYIRKPLRYEKIRQCLEYAWSESEHQGSALVISSRTAHVRVLYKHITYISSGIHCIFVHTRDHKQYTMSIKTSFDEFAKSIPYPFLIRVHRGYIVNLTYVDRFTRDEINLYTDPDSVPIGRQFHEEAISSLKQYFYSDTV